uniref:LAGLIDADG homing endonuclease n=1 Tax=Porodaedalea pini TaxID=108901 RepID=A0A5B9RC91_9AGAM|nr:LAGLIDADG homing endonuclease [Porodaedalea pini]QEG57013.1 LAGLIDADG homing endonuclease [Porodaedalea pini]
MWGKIHITLDTIIYLLFEMKKRDIKDINYLHFLAGFVEGEGSMSVSVSVNDKFKYGVSIQPVFNVTQHKNGMSILNSFKELFEGDLSQLNPVLLIYVFILWKGIKT